MTLGLADFKMINSKHAKSQLRQIYDKNYDVEADAVSMSVFI